MQVSIFLIFIYSVFINYSDQLIQFLSEIRDLTIDYDDFYYVLFLVQCFANNFNFLGFSRIFQCFFEVFKIVVKFFMLLLVSIRICLLQFSVFFYFGNFLKYDCTVFFFYWISQHIINFLFCDSVYYQNQYY